ASRRKKSCERPVREPAIASPATIPRRRRRRASAILCARVSCRLRRPSSSLFRDVLASPLAPCPRLGGACPPVEGAVVSAALGDGKSSRRRHFLNRARRHAG